eukprot:5236319-Amphidinium_carterae.1
MVLMLIIDKNEDKHIHDDNERTLCSGRSCSGSEGRAMLTTKYETQQPCHLAIRVFKGVSVPIPGNQNKVKNTGKS